ncbi:Vps36-domain-containing protein [Choiromyces venosus 120613-1]|uniref:Vacuolar protein-sorting-associated protein 36 n=1 Tax=Choiromyces venosus 120613-1 TaxID=1336337 RepID=A0A3N4K7M4_9PEZI|nr:Vps36-domain-containing protein [Choiromyces venosus 120613-1]
MLSRIDLTPASRPFLLPDETLLFVQNAVGLYEGKYKIPNYQNGSAYLTSHRACYVDDEDPRKFSIAVELKDVDRMEYYAGFLKSSPKITLHLKPQNIANAAAAAASSPGNRSTVSTPKSATPLIRPTSPLPVSTGVWICPICSFSNPIPSNYILQVTPAGSVPPCLACGIRPSPGVLESSFQQPPPRPATTAATTTGDGDEATFACPRCTFLNHCWLRSCEICGEHLLSPDLPTEQLLEITRGESPAPTSMSRKSGQLVWENVEVVKFSFRAGGDKVFHERLKNALIQRKWLLQNAPPVPTPGQGSNGGTSNVVGIAGLERAGLNVRRKNEAAIGGAFEDLEALMGRAKEMVALAEEFSTRLSSTPTFANNEAKAALRNSAQALGIVTKDMLTSTTGSTSNDKASDLYLSELARQVAEFLADDARGILKREGGVITLVDLWAIYNRARGIELISPSDLEKAAGLFEKLKLPVRVRRFRSGLLVVQEARSSDVETVRRIMEWIAGPGWGSGVTAAQAAERFGWSIGVATEELEMAEERGALCREVGVEGVRFWRNWFVEGGGGGRV